MNTREQCDQLPFKPNIGHGLEIRKRSKTIGTEKASREYAHKIGVHFTEARKFHSLAKYYETTSRATQKWLMKCSHDVQFRHVYELSTMPEEWQASALQRVDAGEPLTDVLLGEKTKDSKPEAKTVTDSDEFREVRKRCRAAVKAFDALLERYPWCEPLYKDAIEGFDEVFRAIREWENQR